MKSWIWGIIMIVGNAALWGMMLLLLFVKPSTIEYVGFPLMSILMLAYIFGVIADIQSHIDGKVEDKKDGKNKN
jgi:protein-S-isoprenylcysteine O-methyltransferase Ste14